MVSPEPAVALNETDPLPHLLPAVTAGEEGRLLTVAVMGVRVSVAQPVPVFLATT